MAMKMDQTAGEIKRLKACINNLISVLALPAIWSGHEPAEIGQKLNPWLTGDLRAAPLVMPNPVGKGQVSIAPLRLGLQDQVGVLVAGSQRADFPIEIEMLLLRV